MREAGWVPGAGAAVRGGAAVCRDAAVRRDDAAVRRGDASVGRLVRLGCAFRAELSKLMTLPAAWMTVGLAVVFVGLMCAALSAAGARAAVRSGGSVATVSAAMSVVGALPLLQIGVIVLGTLPVGHEYSGRQIRTSLAAVPSRGMLLAAKTLAAVVAVTVAAVLTVAGALAGAWAGLAGAHVTAAAFTAADIRHLLGAVVALVLLGLLAHAAALLARGAIPALVGVLALVLVVSPLLAAATAQARWLPDRAAALLAGGTADSVLNAGTGALVALAWTVVVGAFGAWRFWRADA